MSQKEPVSRPASPVSTTTPTASSHVSSVSPQIAVRSSDSGPVDVGYQQRAGILGAASEQAQPLPQRNLGVHHILNPTDVQTGATGNSPPRPSHFAHDGGARHGAAAMQYGSNPPTPQPFQFQGQGGPGGSIYGSGPLLPGRQSPSSGHAYPGVGTPRRILTPKSPLPANLGHGQPLRAMNPHGTPYSQPTPPESLRQYSGDAASERSFHPAQSHPHASPMGPVGPPSTLPPSRAMSQSIPGPFGSAAQETPAQTARAPPFSSPTPYTPGVAPANRGFPSPLPSGDPRWGDNYRGGSQSGSPGMRGVPVSDGQIAFRIAPMHGEDITVPVDMHQGSRHADGKRLRNAGASARFRARKKEREMSQQMAMQKLQKENRDLQERVEQMQDACERYRSDRDRLRDIVYRTPSISEYAFQGPPSPPMMRGGMPGPESAQQQQQHHHHHAAVSHPPSSTSVGYGAIEAPSDERPARRRRTESNFEYSTASYLPGPPQYHSSVGYTTAMSQPTTPSEAHGTARLPPLRMDQPADPRPAMSEPGPANTLPRSYSPYKREPYEAGWAVRGGPDPRQL